MAAVISGTPLTLRVSQSLCASDAEAIVRLFEDIASAEGWQPGDQLHAYQKRSTYFGAFDADHLIGGLHLIRPDDAGWLPTHQVWPDLPAIDVPAAVLHAAVLAVLPEYRGRDSSTAFWSLGIALWRYSIEQGVKTVYLEATPKMLRCYRLLGWPLEVVGELRCHWGEPCYPCKLDIRSVAGSLAEKALTSTTYRSIFTAALQPAA